MKGKLTTLFLLLSLSGFTQEIALLKYNGGGDWYANPTSLPNLIKFCNQNINTTIKNKPATVEPGSPDLFSYPYIHATGHGNILFSDSEIKIGKEFWNFFCNSSEGYDAVKTSYAKHAHFLKESLLEIVANFAAV